VTVTVRLFATFRDFLPQASARSALRLDVEGHETIQVLLQALSVPDDLPRIVLVNGYYASEDSLLTDGDVVSVFPPLIGGRSWAGN
jgi:molybdopterin synthase sulfur carrier subunit